MAMTAQDASLLTLIAESLSATGKAVSHKWLNDLTEEAKPIGRELLGSNSGSRKAKRAAKAIRVSVQENREAARNRLGNRVASS